ncbi:MAG: nuclease [Sphingomonas sp.]
MARPSLRPAIALASAAAVLVAPLPAFAWGHQAHAAIDQAAIAALPDDGPVFLRAYSDYVGASATLPDTWRASSEPFSKIAEDPNHGWFREQFAFMKTIPRSRYEFVLALYREYQRIKDSDPAAAKRMNVRWTGTLPYAAMEEYGHLVADMRLLRQARAAGDDAQARFLEQSCAFFVMRMGHYIGDGSQPLHDSVNSDGWRGPDPKGYTRDGSIHGRFETDYVRAIGLTTGEVQQHMAPLGHQHGDLFDEVLRYLDASGDRMEEVYQLDKRGALADPKDQQARALVYRQTAAGASMLRDMIYRAWQESAHAPRATPDPIDPANPAYNPETGSAPAPLDPGA